jgi:transposase
MARKEILPNFENCTEEELERVMNAVPDLKQFRRLFAILMIFRGLEPRDLAATLFVDRQTLRCWIKRFNAEGIDGLLDRARAGRPRKIPPALDAHLEAVLTDPSAAGRTHWTARKFHGYLREELNIEVGYSAAVNWLHDKGWRLKVPRPWPVEQDEALRARFLEELRELLLDPEVEVWYLDEMGVDGDPRPRRRWVRSGEKARLPYGGRHLRHSVTGVVCPRTGEFFALEFNRSNSASLQAFLEHADAQVSLARGRNVVICDNASWHRNKSIDWRRFEVKYLPPYSPDLNPIERLWLLIKAEWFTDFIAKTPEQLLSRLDSALLWAMERDNDNKRTCSIR